MAYVLYGYIKQFDFCFSSGDLGLLAAFVCVVCVYRIMVIRMLKFCYELFEKKRILLILLVYVYKSEAKRVSLSLMRFSMT